MGHEVEEANVNITGLGSLFRIMVEAESAASEVDDPASFSDPYSKWCYERGSKLTAKAYIKATEEMFRRSREIIAQSSKWDCCSQYVIWIATQASVTTVTRFTYLLKLPNAARHPTISIQGS